MKEYEGYRNMNLTVTSATAYLTWPLGESLTRQLVACLNRQLVACLTYN